MVTLLDFFDRYVRGTAVALVHDDGFRRRSYTYDQLRATAVGFAGRLIDAGLTPGDRIVLWGANQPEWVVAFWACMLRGIVVVPADARASEAAVRRIVSVAAPRGVLVGDDLPAIDLPSPGFVWRLRDVVWSATPGSLSPQVRAPATPDTVAEIVFTSGTTGDPKGVVITHRNLVANIVPLEREAERYARWLPLLRPLRFLCLLPLSHMFGQVLALFVPPLVSATTVFVKSHNPGDIVAAIRRHRVILAIMVPRMLELLRDRIVRLAPTSAEPADVNARLWRRVWRHRAAHRLFGWKFAGFVVGGAPLEKALEDFWRRLGLAVIQGYGLTETAPIVAWNLPFKPEHGTVGIPLEGVEVRIASDGEVLVRGSVVTTGYLGAGGQTAAALDGGWLHTGDLGSFDASGHLVIHGRKKDVIVTAEGLKVFPEDVERAVEAVPGVREAAVVARRANAAEHVHAVLVLRAGVDAAAVVRQANAKLESHQRIRDFSVWPDPVLPRTDAIQKLRRYEIRQWVERDAGPRATQPSVETDEVARVLERYAGSRKIDSTMTLDELGLTSLDRIELMMALEQRVGVTLTDAGIAGAHTVGDLHRLVEAAPAAAVQEERFALPRWNRSLPARFVRRLSQTIWILPLARIFLSLRVEGREHLQALRGPVVFAANHQSHFDTPAILSAMPPRWRRQIAVTMSKEFFDAHFVPERHGRLERLTISGLYYLATLLFNAFPLSQKGVDVRQALQYIGELATGEISVLIFPEGHRTDHGEIGPFQAGVGMIASTLRLPVVPIRLEGVERVLHRTWRWPRRGEVTVRFGVPILLEGDDYRSLAQRVEQAVIALQPVRDETSATRGAA